MYRLGFDSYQFGFDACQLVFDGHQLSFDGYQLVFDRHGCQLGFDGHQLAFDDHQLGCDMLGKDLHQNGEVRALRICLAGPNWRRYFVSEWEQKKNDVSALKIGGATSYACEMRSGWCRHDVNAIQKIKSNLRTVGWVQQSIISKRL